MFDKEVRLQILVLGILDSIDNGGKVIAGVATGLN
jgi:hypothetical protein